MPYFLNSLRPISNLLMPWEKAARLLSRCCFAQFFFNFPFLPLTVVYLFYVALTCFVFFLLQTLSISSQKDQVNICTYFSPPTCYHHCSPLREGRREKSRKKVLWCQSHALLKWKESLDHFLLCCTCKSSQNPTCSRWKQFHISCPHNVRYCHSVWLKLMHWNVGSTNVRTAHCCKT